MTYEELKEAINRKQLADVFETLDGIYDQIPDHRRPLYSQLKNERLDGANNITYIDRLKTFLRDIQDLLPTQSFFAQMANVSVRSYLQNSKEFVPVVVLTNTLAYWQSVNGSDAENIPLESYGSTLEVWKPYLQDTIDQLFKEFHQNSGVSLKAYFLDVHQADNLEHIEAEVETNQNQFIVVLDAFALHAHSIQDIARFFDRTNDAFVKGCLIPLHAQHPENQHKFAQNLIQQVFTRLFECWHQHFDKSYLHVELDLPNKIHFFRRLANIAYYRGIKARKKLYRGNTKHENKPSLNEL